MLHQPLSRPDRADAQRRERREKLFAAAFETAEAVGYQSISREAVALRAGIAHGAINHEFRTMAGLREELMREAIRTGRLTIIAQGLACGDPIAKEAPQDLRTAAANIIA